MQPENMAPRDRMRLFCEIRLTYGTSADQVREILRELMRVLRENPQLWSGVKTRASCCASSARPRW
jgi:hypothetical protein